MTAYVKTANHGPLNLRASTSTSSQLLASIPYGTALEVKTINTDWSETTYNGKIGFIMSKYLSYDGDSTITKADIQKIYNSLKETLSLMESILK